MNIEFVEPSRPSRRAWLFAGALWVAVLILGVLHLYLQSRLAREQEARRAAEARSRMPVVTPAAHASPPYLDDALAALKRAALPEADALAELENVAVVGIQLKSIDVNPAVSAVIVELDASSDAVLGDYVDQLNAGLPSPKWHIRRVASRSEAPSAQGVPQGQGNASELTRSATIVREI